MIVIAAVLAILTVAIGTALILLNEGLRCGDLPGDVVVTAVMGATSQPDGKRPVVVASARNPGSLPAIVGLSVRRARMPALLSDALRVSVPRHTTACRFLPERYDVVGVVDAGQSACWWIPVSRSAPRWRLIATVGQTDGRLRVIDRLVGSGPPPTLSHQPQTTPA